MKPICLSIDFEESGITPNSPNVPIQIGVCGLSEDLEIFPVFESYLAAPIEFHDYAQKLHKITFEDCAGKPKLSELASELEILSQVPVAAHDRKVETHHLAKYLPHLKIKWVDTLSLGKRYFADCPALRISKLCPYVQGEAEIQRLFPGKTWHNAIYDAAASLTVVKTILKTYPRLTVEDILVGANPKKHLLQKNEPTLDI